MCHDPHSRSSATRSEEGTAAVVVMMPPHVFPKFAVIQEESTPEGYSRPPHYNYCKLYVLVIVLVVVFVTVSLLRASPTPASPFPRNPLGEGDDAGGGVDAAAGLSKKSGEI